MAVLDGTANPSNPTLLYVHSDHLKRPEFMTNAAKAVVWRALYEPFGTAHSITGAAANQQRFPGQWFQLEAGLHYNWWRHYDAATGRYTQPDPLGLSQGPAPDLFPNGRFANGPPGSSLSTEGLPQAQLGAQPGLMAALVALGQDGRQQPLGMQTGFASANATTVTRDGTSLYGYVGQSPGMRTDPTGEAAWLVPVGISLAVGAGLDYVKASVCSCRATDTGTAYAAAEYGRGLTGPYTDKLRGGVAGGGRSGKNTSIFSSYLYSLSPGNSGGLLRDIGRVTSRASIFLGGAAAAFDIYQISECIGNSR